MNDEHSPLREPEEDGIADAMAAVFLVLIFVAGSIYWISGQ